ncbi:MAG: hypothetical protein L0Y58_09360, partial [Verrucomicrobia subdivision 3 bacterium]|nr:hypothetical protein [Limisphaerales bacterium]
SILKLGSRNRAPEDRRTPRPSELRGVSSASGRRPPEGGTLTLESLTFAGLVSRMGGMGRILKVEAGLKGGSRKGSKVF